MKVLFLDIDGVLNSHQSAIFWHRRRDQSKWENELFQAWEGSLKEYLAQEFCPIATSNLEYIMEQVPDLKIVVSSTWRIGETVETLQKIFNFSEVIPPAIIDTTPIHRDGPRGLEIQAWLDANPGVEKFVIVDDDGDMEHLMEHLVQTDALVGLDNIKALEIIRRLK